MFNGFDLSFCSVSIFHMAFISLERYYVISYPLHYHRTMTSRKLIITISTIWVVSALHGFFQLFFFFSEDNVKFQADNPHLCEHMPSFLFAIVDALLTFVIPLVMMMITYTKVYYIVKQQCKRISSLHGDLQFSSMYLEDSEVNEFLDARVLMDNTYTNGRTRSASAKDLPQSYGIAVTNGILKNGESYTKNNASQANGFATKARSKSVPTNLAVTINKDLPAADGIRLIKAAQLNEQAKRVKCSVEGGELGGAAVPGCGENQGCSTENGTTRPLGANGDCNHDDGVQGYDEINRKADEKLAEGGDCCEIPGENPSENCENEMKQCEECCDKKNNDNQSINGHPQPNNGKNGKTKPVKPKKMILELETINETCAKHIDREFIVPELSPTGTDETNVSDSPQHLKNDKSNTSSSHSNKNLHQNENGDVAAVSGKGCDVSNSKHSNSVGYHCARENGTLEEKVEIRRTSQSSGDSSRTASERYRDTDPSRESSVGDVVFIPSRSSLASTYNGSESHPMALRRKSKRGARKRLRNEMRENKAARMLAIVVGAFVVCWLPYGVCFLTTLACTSGSCVPDAVWEMVNVLLYCSSVVNPLIYSFYSSEFRTAMKKVLFCRR